MSSGNTGRGGRGNRRGRRGAQRPRGAEGQNGQPHSSSAMLILSSSERQTPAHASHEITAGEDAMLEEELESESAAEERAMLDNANGANGASEKRVHDASSFARAMEAGETSSVTDAPARREAEPEPHMPMPAPAPPGSGRGAQERAQPYAPGMRAHSYPPLRRGPSSERSGVVAQSAASFGEDAGVERESDSLAAWREQGDSHEMPALYSRPPRAEHNDRSDHPPLRPEVRGEVGPLIDALRGLFEQDRAVASQGGTTRCGICYLHFSLSELEYREVEGFYVCHACARSLGATRLPMVRRQQRT